MTIHNVSEQGMMLRGRRVPKQGTIIEIRIGDASIVGEVRWVVDNRCGVRSRDKIDVEILLNNSVLQLIKQPGRTSAPMAKVRALSAEQIGERNRLLGRVIDHGLVVGLVIAGAAVLAGVIAEMLGRPLHHIESQIASSPKGRR